MKLKIFISMLLMTPATLLYAEEVTPPPSQPDISGSVHLERPWVKAGEENAIMLPGFVTLKNDASERWVLQQVSARYFRATMIHRTVLQDGEPRMVLQSSLTVRPGETVVMNEQGYHLMFVGPKRKYKKGDKIKVVLQFENQEPVKIDFPVLKKAPN